LQSAKRTKTIQQKLGIEGEKLALHFLNSSGHIILETNWRKNHIELDIIARTKEELVIVEVKTRGSLFFGSPESFVGQKKMNIMAEGAEY
jgi:putative endonuclease